MKILTVLGARPQFIKASVVSAEFAKHAEMEEVVVHTGQHFDANMSGVFFDELAMTEPQYNLNIHSGTHGAMTGRMLEQVEKVLLKEKPDVVLVYGDTNSTLAGALAAAKLHVSVAHVEAGLRSFNMRMPEEINRILTDRISTWLFAPTADAVKHLKAEGMPESAIHQVGDVMYDAALHHGARAENRDKSALQRFGLESKGFVLATVHRAENTDDSKRLQVVVDAFCEVSKTMSVVLPLHPRTRAALIREGLLEKLDAHTQLVEPLGYLDMVELEKHAAVIATDSGGVQKEAFFHKTPCVTLRDETEWVELVEAGWNKVVAPREVTELAAAIVSSVTACGLDVYPYGDGTACIRVFEALLA